MSRMWAVPLLAVTLVALSGAPGWCQEQQPRLLALDSEDASAVHNVGFLRGASERFAQLKALSYPVKVADVDEVNAYADGTKVVFYSGLLNFAQREDEVAYVLGHELGHNVRGHINRMYNSVLGLVIVNAALSEGYEYLPTRDPDVEITQAAQEATLGLLISGYSRVHEYDADKQGIAWMVSAGYDPRAAIDFQERILEKYGSGGAGLWGSHPTSRKRIEQIESLLADDYQQDPVTGRWSPRPVPLHHVQRNTLNRRLSRGVRMSIISGAISWGFGTWEQWDLYNRGAVTASMRRHNVNLGIRNGLIMGFLGGAILIVDVPGSRPPALVGGRGGEPAAWQIGLDAREDRVGIRAVYRF